MACACWVWWWLFFGKVYLLFKPLLPALGYICGLGGEELPSEKLPFITEKSKVQLAIIEISIDIFCAVYAKQFDKQISFSQVLQSVASCLTLSISPDATAVTSDCLKMFHIWDKSSLYSVKGECVGLCTRSTFNNDWGEPVNHCFREGESERKTEWWRGGKMRT